MTDYRFTKVLVWDNLGGSVKVARNSRVTVTDPGTGVTAAGLKVNGQPVPWVTSDSSGHADFTSTLRTVRITAPSGFWEDVTSPDAIEENITAAADAAASAASAASSAQSAQDAANLVGAPADTAIATAVAGAGTQTRTALDGRYAPRYYDDAGTYTDRGAIQTISRNLPNPVNLQPSVWINVSGKGDNTTFKGVVAGQFLARDRTDVDATTKGVLYGVQSVVAPRVDRNNVPFDDVVGLSIENQGSAVGTDGIYFGKARSDKATNPTALDWANIIANDANASTFIKTSGSHTTGLSFSVATIATTAIRFGNGQSISWNYADGSLHHMMRVTSSGTLRIAEADGGLDIRTAFGGIYSQAKVVMPNNTPINGVKFGTTTEVSLIKLDGSDRVSLYSDAVFVASTGEVVLKNGINVQARNAANTANVDLMRLTAGDNLSLYAAKAVVLSNGGVQIANCTSVPSVPTGAAVLYVEAGSLKVKSPSGTITVLAPA